MRIEDINNVLEGLSFIHIETPFKVDDGSTIIGAVGILVEGMPSALVFQTSISSYYPYKVQGIEPIQFRNNSLMEYPHIMAGGSLCLHTSYWVDPIQRLKSDFLQLRDWVVKYYVNKETDVHYEHIVVEPSTVDDCYFAIQFTQFEKKVEADKYGYAFLAPIMDGDYNGKVVKNFVVQSIGDANGNNRIKCLWSSKYDELKYILCPYVVLSKIPCKYNKFALDDFKDLNDYFTSEQLKFLHSYENRFNKKLGGYPVPILLGYKIPSGELHWIASLSKVGNFPTEGIPETKNGIKTGRWLTKFYQDRIQWAMTYDASYNLFFGRGAFCETFTKKKILVIGVGAIGSMFAKTLVKCGCTNISLLDYDLKKPENICRSEYTFLTGVTDKVTELSAELSAISPYVEIKCLPNQYDFAIKSSKFNKQYKEYTINELDSYDLIFDCSTDDDLMHILEELNLKPEIINISITNHASELVCAFSPNIEHFVNIVFNNMLHNDDLDMYAPTGCWSPTFKASYNDIALMIQYAIRHIYNMLNGTEMKQNFILRDTDNGLKILKY